MKKIKNIGTLKINDTVLHQQIDMVVKNQVLDIISQIDESQKVTVPKFVADWYEDHKHDFEYSLYDLCFKYTDRKLNVDLHKWFRDEDNKPFETLVMMHKFGYEVEHEQQYVVAIPDDGRNGFIQLWKSKEGKLLFNFADKIRYGKVHLLTEQEIKQKDERLWQFAKEVEE